MKSDIHYKVATYFFKFNNLRIGRILINNIGKNKKSDGNPKRKNNCLFFVKLHPNPPPLYTEGKFHIKIELQQNPFKERKIHSNFH